MKQTMSKSKSKKARTQERRQRARGIRMLQARNPRGGGVAPRRYNRISESATKESWEAKKKSKEGDRRNTRKNDTTERQYEKGRGTRRTIKGRQKTKKKEKNRCQIPRICIYVQQQSVLPLCEWSTAATSYPDRTALRRKRYAVRIEPRQPPPSTRRLCARSPRTLFRPQTSGDGTRMQNVLGESRATCRLSINSRAGLKSCSPKPQQYQELVGSA